MATQTEKLGLTKPDGEDAYSVEVFNENADIIDGAINTLNEAVGISEGGSGTGLSAKIGISSDTTESSVFGKLNIVNNAVTANGHNIANAKEVIDSNSTKLDNLGNGLSTVGNDVSANGTAIASVGSKADNISNQISTVKTDIASVQSSVNTANTNISSVKTTVESTSGKADTAVELLNLLKALATAKTKQLICCKGVAENSEWQTVVNISGSGVLEKAFARSYTGGGYVRITIDDEIVLLTKTAYQDVVGAIKDDVWSNDVIQTVITTSSGSFMWHSIKQNGGWCIGFPGSVEKAYGYMCVIPNGIRFAKNFKFEVKAMEAGVTVTGEISEDSEVTTL